MRGWCAVALLLLAACGSPPAVEPEEVLNDATERCEDFGYLRGSSDEARCVQRLFAKSAEEREARLRRELAR